jgi:hypothetical protein
VDRKWLPAVVLSAVATVILGIAYLARRLGDISQVEAILYVLAGFLVVGAAASPFVSKTLEQMHQRRQKQVEEETSSITAAIDGLGNPALKKLILFNYQLMDRFIDVALSQAKAAYVFCAAACSAGLLILLTGTVALVAADGVAKQLTVGGLTAVGACLSGFIGHTFIRTFKITSRQMTYYYGQPVVHCYLLHAEWLADRAAHHHSDTSRAFDHDLITATIQAGLDAQRHLLDLIEDEHGEAPEPAASGASSNGVVSPATAAR